MLKYSNLAHLNTIKHTQIYLFTTNIIWLNYLAWDSVIKISLLKEISILCARRAWPIKLSHLAHSQCILSILCRACGPQPTSMPCTIFILSIIIRSFHLRLVIHLTCWNQTRWASNHINCTTSIQIQETSTKSI